MANPQDFCDEILRSVHTSNLHFLVQESPFSLYITLRKKFATQPQTVTKEAKVEADNELNTARDTINILEEKVAQTESKFINECNKLKVKKEEFSEEIKILRESLKKCQAETCEKNKFIGELKKAAKVKDSELYNLEKMCDIANDTIKQLKDKAAELNKDQSQLARSVKIGKEKLEQKVKALENELNSMKTNNNNTVKEVHSALHTLPSVSPVPTSSACSASTLPTPTFTQILTIPVVSEATPSSQ